MEHHCFKTSKAASSTTNVGSKSCNLQTKKKKLSRGNNLQHNGVKATVSKEEETRPEVTQQRNSNKPLWAIGQRQPTYTSTPSIFTTHGGVEKDPAIGNAVASKEKIKPFSKAKSRTRWVERREAGREADDSISSFPLLFKLLPQNFSMANRSLHRFTGHS